MPKESLPDLSITLTFLRSGQGWSQVDLGEASGISVKLLNDYERGRKPLTRERLEYLASCMGLPPACIANTLDCLARNRAAARPPGASSGDRSEAAQRADSLATEIGTLAASFVRSTLSLLTVEGEALQARQKAGFLWDRLAPQKAAERRRLVEGGAKFRTWALVERVAAESIRKAANHPREALELAELSLLIAERVSGEQAWKLRLQGYPCMAILRHHPHGPDSAPWVPGEPRDPRRAPPEGPDGPGPRAGAGSPGAWYRKDDDRQLGDGACRRSGALASPEGRCLPWV